MRVLVTGPGGTDLAGATLRRVGKAVSTAAPDTCELIEVWDEEATRDRVDGEIASGPHVFYFGHGTPYSLGSGEILIDADNIGYARGRIVLAMACSSATDLGPYSVEGGQVAAYLGFVRPIVVPGGRYAHWRDEPWASAGNALLNGATAGKAVDEFREALASEADRVYAEETKRPRHQLVQESGQLVGYGASLVCLGDAGATLGS